MNSASSNLEISRSLQPAAGPFKRAYTGTCLPSLLLPLLPASALSHSRLVGGDDWAAVAAALRQVPRSSPGHSPATSTTRYAHPFGLGPRLPFLLRETGHPNPN